MSARLEAIAGWWAGLGPEARDEAGAVARGGGAYLPTQMLLGLVDAGIFTVTTAQRRDVEDDQASFPMPADVLAYVLSHADRLM